MKVHTVLLLLFFSVLVTPVQNVLSQPVTLLPPDQIGAQHSADIGFAAHTFQHIFHVSTTGSKSNPGTPDKPFRTIVQGLDALKGLSPGQSGAVYVHEGAYREHVMTLSGGQPQAPRALMAAPGEKVRIYGRDPGKPFIRVNQPYWVIAGFEIDASNSHDPENPWQPAVAVVETHHVVIQNIEAHHGSGPAAVSIIGSHDVALIDSHIHEFQEWYRGERIQDSHGVIVGTDNAVTKNSERILIRGNRSWGNGGDSVHCLVGENDAEGNDPNKPKPTDITIEANRYFQDRENAVDIKTCHNITIRGNKFYGYRPADTSRGGAAIVVHRNAERILIEQNRIWDSGMAASMGAATGGGQGKLGAIVFRRNLVFDMTKQGNGAGTGIRVAPATLIEIYHNTFYNVPGYAIRLGDEGTINGATVINNIIAETNPGLSVYLAQISSLFSDRNLFWKAKVPDNWPHDATSIRDKDPLFVENPRYNDFYTRPGSPARDIAISTGDPYEGPGPDIGFQESPE